MDDGGARSEWMEDRCRIMSFSKVISAHQYDPTLMRTDQSPVTTRDGPT